MTTAGVVLPATAAQAGPGDAPAGVLEATALPGETTERVCLSNGFIQVLFINSSGVVVSRIESGTACDPDDGEDVINQEQAGSQVDAVVQQIVPGGIDGDLFRDFGIPINPAITDNQGGFHEASILLEGIVEGPFLLAPAEPALLGGASPGLKSLDGRYSLAAARARGSRFDGLPGDKRFNAWVNGGVVFHDSDRPGLGQDGETGVVSGGVSYLVSPNVNVGIAARYGSTDVSGATGATDADTWSGAAFTQVDLPADFWFAAMLAYSDVDIGARFDQGAVTARGKTDAESFAGQVVLARPLGLPGGLTLVPNLGASFVDIDRDAFTASPTGGGGGGAGVTRVAGSSSTQVSLTGGLNVLTRFLYEGANGKVITITPSLGVNGFTNLALFDPLIGLTGQEFEDDEVGLSVNGGLEVGFESGAALGVATNFAGITGDDYNISVLGGLAIPF